jgi:precorrin-3B synthase
VVGIFAQGDGRVALAAAVPLGLLGAAQVAALGALDGEVRLTPWRGVVVPDQHAEAAATLRDAGLVLDPASPWTGVTACAGRPGCAKSRADVRADALAAHTGRPAPDVAVHWAGCERGCGSPAGPHVRMLALSTGDYRREEIG